MNHVAIVSACRTPIGTIGGQFKTLTALDLSITGTIRMTLEGGVTAYVSRRYVKKIKQALGL